MTLMAWLVSFAGGVFGAAFGAAGAFFLCGLAAIAGSVIFLVTGDPKFGDLVTWGPFLGPHVAFAGGVAAAALAGRRGLLKSGRDVATPLFGLGSPAVLLTGGAFGVLGLGLKALADFLPLTKGLAATNSIALSIVVSGFLVRAVFGRTGLAPRPAAGRGRWRAAPEAGWEPWPVHPSTHILTAAAVSLFAGLVVKELPRAFGLVFGLSAFTLIFLHFGARIPIILHIAWAAEYAVLLTGDPGWGVVFGILAAVLADLFAGLFLLRGDTHIDAPAMSVATTFSLTFLAILLGLPNVLRGLESYLIAVAVGALGILLLNRMKRR